MDATAKNEKIARDIINILAENGCTVNEAQSILRFVSGAVMSNTFVSKVEDKLFEC